MRQYEDKAFGSDISLLDKMADRSEFVAQYSGDKSNFSEIDKEFQRYRRQKLKAFKTQQGTYTAPTVEKMNASDQFFWKRHLKETPGISKTKYIDEHYFDVHKDEFAALRDQQTKERPPQKAVAIF
jgi:hypothetical protein